MSPAAGSAGSVGSATLRRFRWWDIPAAVALEQEAFGADRWSGEQFWSELAGVPSARHFLVAEVEDGVIGYGGLSLAGSTADIQTLAVAPSARRTGVGGRLLDALLEQARVRRCSAVLLEVRADNDGAQELYRSRGFERISHRRGYYDGGRVDALVLRLRLTSLPER